jgi:flavodoxin
VRALILFDSKYGNTQRIAEEIAIVLDQRYDVTLQHADSAEPIDERPDLLIVGSPTHHRNPTDAILREIRSLSAEVLDNVATAAFDTRYDRPRFLTGAASLGIARRLNRRGAAIEIPAQSFYVSAAEGPLLPGEIERAHQWAQQVLYTVRPNLPHG